MCAATPETYRRTAGLECNELPDGYVVCDTARNKVHLLNPTAAAIFELCDGRRNVEAIATIVRTAFYAEATPLADVQQCLIKLLELGLIETAGHSA